MERLELEDVADLDRRLRLERAAVVRTGIARLRLADVGERGLVFASRLDAAQVPAVFVRAGHVLALAQRLVGDDLDLAADRAHRAAPGTEGGADLGFRRRREGRLEDRLELLGAEPVITADERKYEPVADAHGERLRRRRLGDPEERRELLDRPDARRLDAFRGVEWIRKLRGSRDTSGGLDIGEVVAVLAAHQLVLARSRRREEVGRL